MSAQPTDFGGLAGNAGSGALSYAHTQSPDEAKKAGTYEDNRAGILRPKYILDPYIPPVVKKPGMKLR